MVAAFSGLLLRADITMVLPTGEEWQRLHKLGMIIIVLSLASEACCKD